MQASMGKKLLSEQGNGLFGIFVILLIGSIIYYGIFSDANNTYIKISKQEIHQDLQKNWGIFPDQVNLSREFNNKRASITVASGKLKDGSEFHVPYLQRKNSDGDINSTGRISTGCLKNGYTNKIGKAEIDCMAKSFGLI